MAHGAPGQTWGTAWTDAGIICPWTIWKVYGDTRVLERHWASMTRFMDWRQQRAPDFRGKADGNTWGDWLNVNENTPIEMIDAAYFVHDAKLMTQMARALGRNEEVQKYYELHAKLAAQWAQDYLNPDMTLKVDTQTAYVLATRLADIPFPREKGIVGRLAQKIAKNDFRMATGFLGTKHLLPALTEGGLDDLAARLFQSRRFPSWGYEVVNGATTVWERWDSFTKEHGFNGAGGNQNASMNSFSHYSFGAVMEWAFRDLAGIDTDGPGYRRITFRPHPPKPGSNPEQKSLDWVKAEYRSIRGPIRSEWRQREDTFDLNVSIPANTSATVHLPAAVAEAIRESGQPLTQAKGVEVLRSEGDRVVLGVQSGDYRFTANRSR
jgi:alpha-L-rhamnosidase